MQKAVILSQVWVESNSSAAGSRMLQIIDVLKEQNYQITYCSTAKESEFADDLEIETINIQLNNASFDSLIAEINPNIVIYDRFLIEEQFGWRVAETCPNAIRILDTEDLHLLRKTREICVKNNRTFTNHLLFEQEITKREIASILRCDLTLIISKFEMNLLLSHFKIDKNLLCYLPFLVKPSIPKTPEFNQRKHFYFIGNFFHTPNVDAVLQLKKEIWPSIRKQLPKTELHIYGAYPNQQIEQLNNLEEGFIIKGRAKNTSFLLQNYKVCLAPIRFGAGLKGKLLEAMQNQTPSITTTIGAEAMFGNLDWNGFITDDFTKFCKKAIELYTNESSWNKSVLNGNKIIKQVFDIEKYTSNFTIALHKIKQDLPKHRQTNFLGKILHHHTLKSTKYLAKWIEEKNKNAFVN